MRLPPGRHVFIDFETTGRDPEVAEPLEIAAVELIDGVVGRSYTSLIKPMSRVPEEITELTGITDEMVRTAPTPRVVAGQLRLFLENSPRVAHNAPYDETVLTRLCGRPVPAPVLDSVELACMVRPDLPSSGLAFLRRALEVEPREHHRAEADVLMTIDVVLALLAELATRPAQLSAMLTPLRGSNWSWLPTCEAMAAQVAELHADPRSQSRAGPIAAAAAPATTDAPRPAGEVATIDAAEVATLFTARGEEGAEDYRPPRLAAALPGYEPRPQQREMAEHVTAALNTGRHALIEAPTGVGKSLAYLAPLALFARANRAVVCVSTNTKGLQDQLDRKDLPVLHEALGGELSWQVVKGRANYVCKESWREQIAALGEGSSSSERVALGYLGSIAAGPGPGEVGQVRSRMRRKYPELAFLVDRVRGSDCSGQRRHESCPAGRVARSAAKAQIVIINHSLLMTGSQLLPEVDHIVIDEAHALEQRAAGVFSQEVGGRELARLATRLGPKLDERGLSRSFVALCGQAGASAGDGARDEAERLAEQAGRLSAVTARFSELAKDLAWAHRDPEGEYGYVAPEVGLGRLRPDERQRYYAQVEALQQALHATRRAVDEALRRLDLLELDGKARARRRVLERALADTKFGLYDQLSVLDELASPSKKREVRVLRSRVDAPERWSLKIEPLVLAEELHGKVFARHRAAIVTSATLALGDRGDYIAQRIGYPDDPERAAPLVRLSSPWDPRTAALNLIVEDLPSIRDPEGRASAMAGLIENVASVLGGRTLVLFCAAARMQRTAELCRPLLAARGLTVLEQERDGWVRDLLRRMRRDSGTVLFGLQSFWNGVDIAGPALSCVIVERVPFASQKRPLVAARMALEGEGFAGFERYLLPTALLDLRQGAGRLLRRGDDRGVVVLCHEQLSDKGYHDRVLSVLPGGESQSVPHAEIADVLRAGCETLGIATPTSTKASTNT